MAVELILERIIQVQSFSIQSLYPGTKPTRRNERHLIIKLCTYIITLINFISSPIQRKMPHPLRLSQEQELALNDMIQKFVTN